MNLALAVEEIRRFNRFYTNIIGVLDRHILESPYSLSEARVLFELHHLGDCTARTVMQSIDIDEGYLSRILDRFVKKGLLAKTKSASDGRAYLLSLTDEGRKEFEKINHASAQEVNILASALAPNELKQLLVHMESIRQILSQHHEKFGQP